MKLLDVFSYVVIAFALMAASVVVRSMELWTPTLADSVAWTFQSLGLAYLIVGSTCTVCQKPVKDLCPWSGFWVTFLVGFMMLFSTFLTAWNTSFAQVWPESLECLFFLGMLVVLFTVPRSYYYD